MDASSTDETALLYNLNQKDPLTRLGPSLFLSVLRYLPFEDLLGIEPVCKAWRRVLQNHSRGIWRPACHDIGVEQSVIDVLQASERAADSVLTPGSCEVPLSESIHDAASVTVNWRDVCKTHVEHEKNWRFGRAREKWITPEHNTVWRIKVDLEERTLISTSRMQGLLVSDLATSEPLFQIDSVHPWAHLEFAKGFVIFNHTFHGNDDGIHVYRTQPCIHRSSRPGPASHKRPRAASFGTSRSADIDMRTHTGHLPRGHLTFFRRIMPPTDCIAFRARLDHEGTHKERAMLGTAGEEAVFIWDLDDAEYVERIDIPPEHQCRIQYIEFDDEYVFLCSVEQMHVYSRKTKARVMAFPPVGSFDTTSRVVMNFFASGHRDDLFVRRLDSRENKRPTPVRALIRQSKPDEDSILRVKMMQAGRQGWSPSFIACHYTTRDLYCATLAGVLLVIRDYRRVLSMPTEEERWIALQEHTIWLAFGERQDGGLSHLTTFRERVSFAADDHVFFLDSSTLPDMPLRESPSVPETVIHRVESTHRMGVQNSGCLQMDRSNIYMAYCTFGEETENGVKDPQTGEVIRPPERASSGFSCCVRAWDFTP